MWSGIEPHVASAVSTVAVATIGALFGYLGQVLRTHATQRRDEAAASKAEASAQADLQRTIDTAVAGIIAHYTTALHDQTEEVARLRGEIESQREEIAELRMTVERQNTEIDTLQQHIAALSAELRSRGIDPPPHDPPSIDPDPAPRRRRTSTASRT